MPNIYFSFTTCTLKNLSDLFINVFQFSMNASLVFLMIKMLNLTKVY